jgi:hypothetical protein
MKNHRLLLAEDFDNICCYVNKAGVSLACESLTRAESAKTDLQVYSQIFVSFEMDVILHSTSKVVALSLPSVRKNEQEIIFWRTCLDLLEEQNVKPLQFKAELYGVQIVAFLKKYVIGYYSSLYFRISLLRSLLYLSLSRAAIMSHLILYLLELIAMLSKILRSQAVCSLISYKCESQESRALGFNMYYEKVYLPIVSLECTHICSPFLICLVL